MPCASLAPTSGVLDDYRDFPVARTASGLAYVNIQDEFVAWLCFANAGMLSKGNLLCFDYALRNLPSDNPMVEIGVCAGLSTNVLTHYRRKHAVRAPFFNCDRWVFEGARPGQPLGDSPVTHDEYRAFVRESYLRNVRAFSKDDLPHTIEVFSDEFFAAWGSRERCTDLFGNSCEPGGPISFCYIDGDHSYAQARRDFENADRFLEIGGFILFDDSADGSTFEVARVVEEVKRLPHYRVVVKNPNYLVQKVSPCPR